MLDKQKQAITYLNSISQQEQKLEWQFQKPNYPIYKNVPFKNKSSPIQTCQIFTPLYLDFNCLQIKNQSTINILKETKINRNSFYSYIPKSVKSNLIQQQKNKRQAISNQQNFPVLIQRNQKLKGRKSQLNKSVNCNWDQKRKKKEMKTITSQDLGINCLNKELSQKKMIGRYTKYKNWIVKKKMQDPNNLKRLSLYLGI